MKQVESYIISNKDETDFLIADTEMTHGADMVSL